MHVGVEQHDDAAVDSAEYELGSSRRELNYGRFNMLMSNTVCCVYVGFMMNHCCLESRGHDVGYGTT
jgi:hypothetical protein